MKRETYVRMMKGIKAHPKAVNLICKGNSILTSVVYAIYLLFMFWLLIDKNENFLRILCTTAVSFVIVSIFRKIFNRPRPYEKFGETSVIPKEKKGNSFPSRHVFSAFVIAGSFCFVNLWLGGTLLVVATGIAILRVVGGVHFPIDVIVGAFVGVVCAITGMCVL